MKGNKGFSAQARALRLGVKGTVPACIGRLEPPGNHRPAHGAIPYQVSFALVDKQEVGA